MSIKHYLILWKNIELLKYYINHSLNQSNYFYNLIENEVNEDKLKTFSYNSNKYFEISNINLEKLLDFHKSHGKVCTITAVRPSARFGELNIDENSSVRSFREKPQLKEGWINGGFLVVEPEFMDFIPEENVMLEKQPMDKLSQDKQLKAYKHEGFWQCMDTLRDKKLLESLYQNGAPWIIRD